jgi:branched-chain amino acid transport system substrate-binding protein
VVLPYAPPFGVYSKSVEITMKMAVEEAGGEVAGRKIELMIEDDENKPPVAIAKAKKLFLSDKVDVLIGGTTTGATMAMAPLVDKAGLPFISLAGAVVIIDPMKKWVFKTPHTDRMAAEKVFEDMK